MKSKLAVWVALGAVLLSGAVQGPALAQVVQFHTAEPYGKEN